MTEGSARDADGTPTTGNAESRRAGRRRTRARVDAVPDGGRIDRTATSTPQIVLAVSALVLVTVISFVAVSVVGALFVANRQTYWMIELIFALLCGGAGALVGGSAVVRSTLRIPGSPVHATL